MRHIAIIGSGPAGYYSAEAALKRWGNDIAIDVFDKLPVPYGLIRSGVAPDHQSIKAVTRRYEQTALSANVRFIGNVAIGADVSMAELGQLYDAVVLATGAPHDRLLGMPGENLKNIFGSAAFVGWYNGQPEFATLDPDLRGTDVVVIGMGNVALDVARILAKTRAEFAGSDIVGHALDALGGARVQRITIVGRRGPHQIMMTPKELGELVHLTHAAPRVDPADLPEIGEDALLEPGLRKSVNHLRGFATIPEHVRADKAIEVAFDFFASPTKLIGDKNGKVSGIEVERTTVQAGRAVGTGETYVIPASLIVACIGYQTSPIAGVPFDERAGRFANHEGRILPGLYCVGWAQHGPSGTIGTNRPDAFGVIERIAEDWNAGQNWEAGQNQEAGANSRKLGAAGFDTLASARGLDVMTFADWKAIELAETARARVDAPREKFVDIAAMIAARLA